MTSGIEAAGPPRIYRGVRREGVAVVTVDDLPLASRREVFDFGARDFEWGYHGWGPAQLALAVVLDHVEHVSGELGRLRRTCGLPERCEACDGVAPVAASCVRCGPGSLGHVHQLALRVHQPVRSRLIVPLARRSSSWTFGSPLVAAVLDGLLRDLDAWRRRMAARARSCEEVSGQ